jgi:hypothetical protein
VTNPNNFVSKDSPDKELPKPTVPVSSVYLSVKTSWQAIQSIKLYLRSYITVGTKTIPQDGKQGKRSAFAEYLHCTLTEHHAMKAYWGSGGAASCYSWPRH